MVVPKKVYVHAAEKPKSRSRGARRSIQFPFRSSATADDSSISTNSYMDEEDDLQPVFQDVADALYKNTSPFMETTLIDFSKRTKAGDEDDDDESKGRRRKEKRKTKRRRSVKPKTKPETVRSPPNARSNGQETKTKEQPLVDKTLENKYASYISATGKLSFESDEPIVTERREPAVSVRTEELVNGKHPVLARQPSLPNSYANQQNRQQPTKRRSLPHNKSRRVTEQNTKEKMNPLKVHLPTNRFAYDTTGLPLSDAIQEANAEIEIKANGETVEESTPGRASVFSKTRSRSLRSRSPVNLEAIPAFSKSYSQGSRSRVLGLRRSLSRIRFKKSKKDRQRAASAASTSSPSFPPSIQQESLANASEIVNPPFKPQQESKVPADVNALDCLLAQQLVREPAELFAGLAKELESLWSCSPNWLEEPNQVEAVAAVVVDGRNDSSTQKQAVDSSEQTREKRENLEEDKVIKLPETSAFQAPENQTQSCSSTVTPLDGFRSYMNFMIAASKQLTLSPSINSLSTVPSVSAREFPTTPNIPLASASPPPASGAAAAAAAAAAPPSAATTATTDRHQGGLPPLCPQKPTKRTRSGNLQMLRIRFRRDSSVGRRDSSVGTRSGSSRASSNSSPSVVIIK